MKRAALLLPLALAGLAWAASRRSSGGGLDLATEANEQAGEGGSSSGSWSIETATNAIITGMGEAVTAVRKVFELPARAAPYADTIADAETRYGLPPSLLGRVLYQESRFRTDIITGQTRSTAGALGIAQFMPGTAREMGIDPLNPTQAIDGAARYLRRLYDALGDWSKALAAYNWGIGNVSRKGLDAAPAETRAYVREILSDVEV